MNRTEGMEAAEAVLQLGLDGGATQPEAGVLLGELRHLPADLVAILDDGVVEVAVAERSGH